MRIELENQGYAPQLCHHCGGWGVVLKEKSDGSSFVEKVCPTCLGERIELVSTTIKDIEVFAFLRTRDYDIKENQR